MTASKPTVSILYGFGEGHRVSPRLRQAFADAGFEVTSNATQADYIVAHSGGCFLVPDNRRAQHIVLIGVPYVPIYTLPKILIRKVWRDMLWHYRIKDMSFWLHKTGWNLTYMWRIPYDIRMLRAMHAGRHWNMEGNITVVHYEDDIYCEPGELPFAHKQQAHIAPGQHDECWRDPEPIVRIVQSIYGS